MKMKIMMFITVLSLSFGIFTIAHKSQATYYMTPGGFYGVYGDDFSSNPLNDYYMIEGTPNNPGRIYPKGYLPPTSSPTASSLSQPITTQPYYTAPRTGADAPPVNCPQTSSMTKSYYDSLYERYWYPYYYQPGMN